MITHPVSPARARAAARLAAVLLLLGAAAPAAAQQPRDTSRVVPADTTPSAASAAPLAGPRREVGWQPYRPQLLPRADARASAGGDSMQTIRISTVALVLIGVLVLLLIAR